MTGVCLDNFKERWGKESNKFRHTLIQKLQSRGVEPSYENCKNYFEGRIKPYKDPRSGIVSHIHIRDIIKNERRNKKRGTTRPMEKKYRHKKRRTK
jgi:hypothetical protein